MRLLEKPVLALGAAESICEQLNDEQIDYVLSPAVGGITWGFAIAQQFPKSTSIFAERIDGKLTLRRGFQIPSGARVMLAEDVVTTGGSLLEVYHIAANAGAKIIGAAVVFDRSGGEFRMDCPIHAFASSRIPSWEPNECPLCRAGVDTETPGSRHLGSAKGKQ